MARWLTGVVVTVLVLFAFGGARADFSLPGVQADADAYQSLIMKKAPPAPQPAARDAALADAQAAVAAGDGAKAVPAFERAITMGAANPEVWLNLSRAWMLGSKPNRARALQSAFIAYGLPTDDTARAAPLWEMAGLLETAFQRPDQAIDALREMADIDERTGQRRVLTAFPSLTARLHDLRVMVGLMVKGARIDTSGPLARVCYTLNDELAQRSPVHWDDFVKVEPKADAAVDREDDGLCIGGLAYGTRYALTLRQGLPGIDGMVLKTDDARTIDIGDRHPMVSFRGNGFVLPRASAQGIAISTVNTNRVALTVYRINDRGLPSTIRGNELLSTLNSYSATDIADGSGERVWQGSMAVPDAAANSEVTLAIPFKEMVASPAPGFYIITAAPKDDAAADHTDGLATQWVLVSDIALTTMDGTDGINVFARSIETAKPMTGVDIALVARNAEELARVKTDADGHARFPVGLTRGKGGRQPIAVMAYAGNDYGVLDLTAPAFDLSDRGVGGRDPSGPIDAFLYTDRGVYRPGETVNLSLLLRDDANIAVGGQPITLKVMRPSGTVFLNEPVTTSEVGLAVRAIALSKTAPLGQWTVEVYTDPKGKPVATRDFAVDDFVPERLAVELTPSVPSIAAGKPAQVTAKARFLYGPPAAGLSGTADVELSVDDAPYAAFGGYQFGLVEEKLTGKVEALAFPVTDADGQSVIDVRLPPAPDTTLPLKAEVRVAVSEPGGRPTRQSLSLPVRTQPYALGIRGQFDRDGVAEGHSADFDVVAVAADGKPVAKPALAWSLFEEVPNYTWYLNNGRYTYRVSRHDRLVKSGVFDVGPDKPAVVRSGALGWGRFRLEVADKAAGVASSLRFTSGWVPVAADVVDTPDKLDLTTDKPAYRVGETARLRIAPPFAGEVLVTVSGDRLYQSRTLFVGAEGTTIELPVDPAWGAGAYVTATVYRPPVHGKDHQPVRAIGIAWLAADPADRRLAVTMDALAIAKPGQPLDVDLRLDPVDAGSPAFVTLAAVDEGILQLTDFVSPDPLKYFFGKRRLGVDIRDQYGRLIDPLDDAWGTLRQGGDSGSASLPVVPFKVVSLFTGPVAVGPDGHVKVKLDIPDFDGQLRLIAVAASKTRVGSASRPVTIRDTLVADAVLPRFLAPGDNSRVTVNLHNVDDAAKHIDLVVEGTGAVGVENGGITVDLAAGERRTLGIPLQGVLPGTGTIRVRASEAGGKPVQHDYAITVRPAWVAETKTTSDRMAPGTEVTLGASLLAPYMPSTALVVATLGAAAPFDVAGILKALDRYPYGCLEQTVSRALPLLSVRDADAAPGRSGAKDIGLEERIQQAVTTTLDRQRFDGAFGLWAAQSEAEPWLSAYAMEFLTRARTRHYLVVDAAYRNGLDWLRAHAVDGGDDSDSLASRAYAHYVLALAGVATPAPARYFNDAFLDKLPTPLARGHIAAALARLGDRPRALKAFAAAIDKLDRTPYGPDYGSTVRDAAAIAVLLAESGVTDGMDTVLNHLPAGDVTVERTNTQEKAWAALAGEALATGATVPKLSLNGQPLRGQGPTTLTLTGDDLTVDAKIANTGGKPVWRTISVIGVPTTAPVAARDGLRIKRQFVGRDGKDINLDAIRQNDVFVLVLSGEAQTKLTHRAMVSHLLPAGWEIEHAVVEGGEGTSMPWLTDLTTPVNVEGGDDRYAAAVDLTPDSPSFKLAFMVRAVTPGSYALPGAVVEDMYRPAYFARQATGRINVIPSAP